MKRKGITYFIIFVYILNSLCFNITARAIENRDNNDTISYTGDGYYITMQADNIWEDGFTANIEIKNTSDRTIKDWYLSFELSNDMIDIWNAEIYKKKNNLYIIKNASCNKNIKPSETASFGIQCKGKLTTLPGYFGMLGKRAVITSDKYSIEYKITSDWEDKFIAEVSIINKSNKDIHNWELQATYQNEIVQIWNATIEKHEGDTYCISNNQYNSDIKCNESVTFGIVVNKGNGTYFENCNVYESVCEEQQNNDNIYIDGQLNKEKNILNIDIFSTSINKGYEIYLVKELEEPKLIEKTNSEEYSITIKEITGNLSCYVLQRLTNGIISSNVLSLTYTNGEYNIDIIDTDKDKIPDHLEALYGTDSHNHDTDGDGLLDGDEILFSHTNPLKSDSDDNGVMDGEEDFDHDNLINRLEISLKTNPLNKDSDSDGLMDNEEIKKYNTNPTNPNSDEDGINDGDEIELSLNPLKKDTDDNGINDGEEYIEQIIDNDSIDDNVFENNIASPIEIKLKARGNVNQKADIGEYEGDLFEEEESSIVGKPIYIDNVDLETGSIRFAISNEYTISQHDIGGQYVTPFVICRHDIEGGNTEPIETEYNETNRTLTATIHSPGIYFVVDVYDMLQEFGIDIESTPSINMKKAAKASTIASQTVNGKADIVFLVDTTISMDYYINRVKANIKAFSKELSNAGVSASYALVEYRDITCDGKNSTKIKKNGNSNWYKSVTSFEQAIDKLEADGGGDLKETPIDALEKARRMKFRKNAQKFFVLVTDTDYKLDNNYGIESMEEAVNLLKEDEITVSVVGNKHHYKEYDALIHKTGGVFAAIDGDFKDYLLGIADRIGDEINERYWIALDGLVPQVVRLDNKPTENSNTDTDNDTIPDSDELQSLEPTKYISVTPYLKALKIKGGGTQKIPVYEYKSKPTVKDTDKDGIPDKYDAKPKKSFTKTFLTNKKRKTYQFLSGEDIFKHKIGKNYDIYGIDLNKFMPKSKNVEKNIKNNASHEQDVYKNRFCTKYKTELERSIALTSILTRAKMTQATAFALNNNGMLPMSYSFLSHYLGMHVEQKKYLFNVDMKGINDKMGAKVEFDADKLIRKTPSGTSRFVNMTNDMMRVCESTVKKNCILMFSTVDSISYCGYNPDFNYSVSPYATINNFIDYDGFTSLNKADAGATFRCSYNGETYSLTLNYYILDFYDFYEKQKPLYSQVGFASNDEYVVLSYYNKAAPFRVVGNYRETITWKKGKMYEANYQKTYYYD